MLRLTQRVVAQSLFALGLLSAFACSADTIDPDMNREPDADLGPVLPTLEVDSPGASTMWGSIPVTGKGPANGTLLFTTPGGGQFSEDLGDSGDFCVDVILQRNSVNTIKFEAIDQEGTYTDPVLIDVRQEGEPPTEEPEEPKPGYANIAANADINDMTVNVEEGDVSALVDGDSTGYVSLTNTNGADWLVVELNERLPIQQIHIETTQDCPMESFKILLTDDSQSGDPLIDGIFGSSYGPGWIMIANVEEESDDHTVVPSIGDPLARRLALQFTSGDCGSLITGRHKLKEIEVWARTENSGGGGGGNNSGAPSCTAQ